jgi:hypothetical protein
VILVIFRFWMRARACSINECRRMGGCGARLILVVARRCGIVRRAILMVTDDSAVLLLSCLFSGMGAVDGRANSRFKSKNLCQRICDYSPPALISTFVPGGWLVRRTTRARRADFPWRPTIADTPLSTRHRSYQDWKMEAMRRHAVKTVLISPKRRKNR